MPDTPTYLDLTGLTTYDGLIKAEISGKIDIGGRAGKIPYGNVDATSTATVFTATVDGLTELTDGTCVMLHNGVITSASGFTVNVNGLGAKKCYNNLTNATQDTTIFNVAYTMLFVYATALDGGNGGWWIYRGYDANTNTIGYQLRTNSGNKVASDTGYRYRIWLTSADNSKWVPINTSTSTNGTSNRTLNTRPIDPFGPIVYRATNGTCTSGTGIGATGIWQQYTLTIGYSYMASGFSLTFPDSVYLRCTPQANGSAVMQDIVQALPSSKDGKIYIHLGTAYSATAMELTIDHPVYWHDGTGVRLWTGAESGGGSTVSVTQTLTSGTEIASVSVDGTATKLYAPTPPTVPSASSTTPAMDGTAAVGTATTYARADHVHPTDTSRVAASVTNANGLTGTITNTGSVKLESVTSSGKTATVSATAVGSQLLCEDEDSENYAIVDVRTTYAKVEAEGASGTSSVTVQPSGVSIDKLVTPTTSTMPTTKQYVDDGLAAKQDTLVSGTSIKTVNGNSLLGSGDIATPTYTLPTASTSTLGGVKVDGTSITIEDGVISSQSGIDTSCIELECALQGYAWVNKRQTILSNFIKEDSRIIVAPASDGGAAWDRYGIACISQEEGSITFSYSASTSITKTIPINVLVINQENKPTTYTITNNGGQSYGPDKYKATEGELVKVNGMALSQVSVYKTGDTSTVIITRATIPSNGSGITFTMPAYDVTVGPYTHPK